MSLSLERLKAIATAVFQSEPLRVVEAYSDFDSPLRSFHSPGDLIDYVVARQDSSSSSAHFAVYYPDMEGQVVQSKIALDPKRCDGHTHRFKIEGWGLIWIHLQWRDIAPGSFISANSEKRANAWASTNPELGSTAAWNWLAVNRHLRRLRRVFKMAA